MAMSRSTGIFLSFLSRLTQALTSGGETEKGGRENVDITVTVRCSISSTLS